MVLATIEAALTATRISLLDGDQRKDNNMYRSPCGHDAGIRRVDHQAIHPAASTVTLSLQKLLTYWVDGVRLGAHGEGDAWEALREALSVAVGVADRVHIQPAARPEPEGKLHLHYDCHCV